MERRHKDEMMLVLDEYLAEKAFEGREVFLFGHCNATEEMANYLLEHGVRVAAILDNSVSKQGKAYRGIFIAGPERIRACDAGNSIVLIATRFYAEMWAQLRERGYDGKIVRVVEYNTFSEYSLSDETVENKKARMRRGMQTLKRIRADYPSHFLVICPNNALGDVYWAMSFLPAYCEKFALGKIAAVVVGNGCRQVAELFGMGNIMVLDHAEVDELVQAIIFTCDENCIVAHHDRPYTDNIIKYLNRHFLSFLDYYCCAVYGLSRSTKPTLPTGFREFTQMPRIAKGKTVIMAPYAKSVVQPPASFWEGLAEEWLGRGYSVCTSLNSGEQPIKGTKPLSLPLNQMVAAAEYAGVFIGLRSGLCDIVHTARCQKIVVFPDCFYSTTPHKVEDFFALPGWEKKIFSHEF